ncbi:TRIAP1/MDM35 family protein SCDLUD_004161 [Saccharomycodes ludwigii]|uniref:TRIAP1/MDM35 family protein n=1 Tax=Saccharomycodes ludwigii TaxID=36035 RepID=UPI001E86D371|nr:hypothetical protein SCDLUD_004161 [Saccharomycodes ludwigii]KAH3899862.1 hypothetical protein SCDLUD_004161 [Saccharomycodes ludwigii]
MGNSLSVPNFATECSDLKQKYDKCFDHYYSEEFLKGKGMENDCISEWHDYMLCVNTQLVRKGIRDISTFQEDELPDELIEEYKKSSSS